MCAQKIDQPDTDDLNGRVVRLEEEIKERQPSLLGAIKTLIGDYRDFRQGKRKFPESALLGVVFAYLRPRIVLVLGSVAAALVGASQLILLVQQNNLVRQQNALIKEQGYALRAQTAAALLSDIGDGKEIPAAKVALLTAFGDVGFEALLQLASAESGAVEEPAMNALIKAASRLTPEQARTAFYQLLILQVNRMAGLDNLLSEKISETFQRQNVVDKLAEVEIVKDLPDKLRNVQHGAFLFAAFVDARLPLESDFPNDSDIGRHLTSISLARYYAAAFETHEYKIPRSLDRYFSFVCNTLGGANNTDTIAEGIIASADSLTDNLRRYESAALVAAYIRARCRAGEGSMFVQRYSTTPGDPRNATMFFANDTSLAEDVLRKALDSSKKVY